MFAATLEDWVAPRQNWELQLREGHDSGRANNMRRAVPSLIALSIPSGVAWTVKVIVVVETLPSVVAP